MKFHELAIGQKFEFQGTAFVKSTPMIASALDTSTQKFMARSATVKPLDIMVASSSTNPSKLCVDVVNNAFEIFYASCQATLEEIHRELSAESFLLVKEKLKNERQIFLNSI
ncbi:hypothetical protein [Sulfurirhabdus autotrophica]|uniref:Uncharacterized protein n=1 Tax=Sulfurirhabdus autotrophica TaxID=1706046 RepID=A0A4R3YET7_9PROT|nr:hypothetical protein [Sulfurirhabdus autotrophica]TCV90461.1 hypothetical protein EDC63_101434 [Sulfurirhabdus autotrophica]